MDRVTEQRRRVRRSLAALALAGAALALGGCVDDGYGYGGVYGGGGFYGPSYYDGGVYGAGWPSYGWYDGFYYPGSGLYVYDRGGRRSRWDGPHGSWHGHPPGGGGWHGGWAGGPGGRPPGGWNHGPGGRPGGNPGDWHHDGRPGGNPGDGRGRAGGSMGAGTVLVPHAPGSAPSAGGARPQGHFGGFGGGGRRGGGGRGR
jgi:hypothetical protein